MLRSFNCSGSLVLCEADFVGGLVGFELVIPVDFPIIHMTHRPRILAVAEGEADYRFVRFRPPLLQLDAHGERGLLPQIRLDRALQFLLGDRLA